MALKLTATKLLSGALLCGAAVLLVLGVGETTPQPPARYQAITPAKNFPPAHLIGSDGAVHALKDFTGKVLIVNFWATWCAPCVKELPALDRLARALPENRFVLLLVGEGNKSRSKETARLRELNIASAFYYSDPGSELRRALGVRGLPTTFIAGKKGLFTAKFEGSLRWDSPEIKNWLQAVSRSARVPDLQPDSALSSASANLVISPRRTEPQIHKKVRSPSTAPALNTVTNPSGLARPPMTNALNAGRARTVRP
ncbi:MAG: TlpA family protein disulfide reductase [Rhodospirillales bacterium]|nr:TlpA family protein disulfide reductase [Rhodospirillales bacterium]